MSIATNSPVVVPNRSFRLEPGTNWSQLVFHTFDLWQFPIAINALKPRILWSRNMDHDILLTIFTPEIYKEFFEWRVVFSTLNASMDFKPHLESLEDIWYLIGPFDKLEPRISELFDACDYYQDHPDLKALIDVAWQIMGSVKAFIPTMEDCFWKMLARLWVYRFRAVDASLATIDFGMDEMRLKVKLDLLARA